jgi:MFS family permease
LLRDPLILPFYVPSFVVFLGYGLTAPVLPLYAESFDVSYGWVGAMISAQSLGMLLTDLPSGMLLRRFGQKRSMLLGILLMVLMRMAFFWAGSIQEAFVYHLIAGFGMALFGVARHAYITEHAPIATRGRTMALFGGILRIGRFIGPLIGGYVAAQWGLRESFLVAGAISLPAIASVIAFVPGGQLGRSAASAPRQAPAASSGERLTGMLRRQAHLLIPAGLGQIFVQMIRSGRGTVIPLYASNVVGLDVDQVGLMLSIAAAVEMVMFIPAGWIMDNLGRKYAYLPSFGLQALAMACVPLTQRFGGLLLCTTLIGLGNGLSSGGMMTLGSDLAPERARAEFFGVWRLIGDFGGTGGPAVVGFVADALTLPSAALAMAASGLMAVLIFGFFLPETLVREPGGPAESASQA